MDLRSTLRSTLREYSTLGVSDFLRKDPSLIPFPGGAAYADAASAIVNIAVNRVVMFFVFIICVVGLGGVHVGRFSRKTLNTAFKRLYTCPFTNPWRNPAWFRPRLAAIARSHVLNVPEGL